MKREARAALLEKANEPLRVREISIPELKQGCVLVKTVASGVCGTDVHCWRGHVKMPLPMILGHELLLLGLPVPGRRLLGVCISDWEIIFFQGSQVGFHRGSHCLRMRLSHGGQGIRDDWRRGARQKRVDPGGRTGRAVLRGHGETWGRVSDHGDGRAAVEAGDGAQAWR